MQNGPNCSTAGGGLRELPGWGWLGLFNKRRGRLVHIQDKGIGRLFKNCELTRKQRFMHKMTGPVEEAGLKHMRFRLKIDEPNTIAATGEGHLTIAGFQER